VKLFKFHRMTADDGYGETNPAVAAALGWNSALLLQLQWRKNTILRGFTLTLSCRWSFLTHERVEAGEGVSQAGCCSDSTFLL
jgi:hypothetical protein